MSVRDKLYEKELWRERERGVSRYNEVYGGGWVMRGGRVWESKVRKDRAGEVEREALLPNSSPSVGAGVDLCV